MYQKIMQFWDKKNIPHEVQQLMHGVQKHNPDWCHVIFDEEGALLFIEKYYPEEVKTAFLMCKVPAMKADLFRYAYLYNEGGFYLDADVTCHSSLNNLLKGNVSALFFRRQNRVANDAIFVPARFDIIKLALDLAVSNVLSKVSNDIWSVTGPGVLREAVQSTLELPKQYTRKLQNSFEVKHKDYLVRIVPVSQMKKSLAYKWEMEYKEEHGHWSEIQQNNCIYNDRS